MLSLDTLTLEQARTIEAGVECDALVHAATGVTYEHKPFVSIDAGDPHEGTYRCPRCGDSCGGFSLEDVFSGIPADKGWRCEPEFSTDANAAIEAAEAALKQCVAVEITRSRVGWSVETTNDGLLRDFCEAPTFPLALCRAILVRYVLERDAK